MPRGMKRTATNRSRAYLFIHNVRKFLLYSFERIEKKVVINHLVYGNFFVLPSSAEASVDLCFLVHLGSFWLTFFFLLPYNE